MSIFGYNTRRKKRGILRPGKWEGGGGDRRREKLPRSLRVDNLRARGVSEFTRSPNRFSPSDSSGR